MSAPAYALGLALCIAWLFVAAGHFLPFQALWVDETTQLSGIGLGPERLMPWLGGQGPDLGVPGDRTPPLSYLLQMVWARAFGLDEIGMRWLGLGCTALCVAFASMAARRAFGTAAGWVTAGFIALSPTVLVSALEIRAYPLYLMFSAISLYALVGTVLAHPERRAGWLAFLAAGLLATTYTHFFGAILSAAVFAALLADAIRSRIGLRRLLVVAVVVAVLDIGLLPFVRSSIGMSASGEGADYLGIPIRFVKLFYRLYGHPALAGSTVATVLATAGFLALGLLFATSRGGRSPVRAALVTALLVGVGLDLVAAVVVHGFDTLSPSYNFWTVPLVAILLGSATTGVAPKLRPWAAVAAAMLAVGMVYSSVRLYREPELYVHGPQHRLFATIDRLGANQVDLVYSPAPNDAFGLTVFAVRYRYGRALPQYRLEPAAASIARFDDHDPVAEAPSRRYAVVVEARSIGAGELARIADHSAPDTPVPLATVRLQRDGWRLVRSDWRPGMVTARIDLLERPR